MSTTTSTCVAPVVAAACCKEVSEIMRFIGSAPLIRPHDRNYSVGSAPELRCLLSNENLFRESRTTEAFQNGVSRKGQAAPSTSSHRPKVAALLGVAQQVSVPDRRRRDRSTGDQEPRGCFDQAALISPSWVSAVTPSSRPISSTTLPLITFSTVVPVKCIFRPVAAGRPPTRKSLKAGPVWVPPPSH